MNIQTNRNNDHFIPPAKEQDVTRKIYCYTLPSADLIQNRYSY